MRTIVAAALASAATLAAAAPANAQREPRPRSEYGAALGIGAGVLLGSVPLLVASGTAFDDVVRAHASREVPIALLGFGLAAHAFGVACIVHGAWGLRAPRVTAAPVVSAGFVGATLAVRF